jgi:hypothetical protein
VSLQAFQSASFIGDDKKNELIDIINEFNPDVISMEEFPEFLWKIRYQI